MAPVDVELSLTEWIILSLVSEGPTHGFALAREVARGTTLGQVWTVPRPLVYRALSRIEAQGLAVQKGEEPGDPGPPRTIYRVTPKGRRAVAAWRSEPVQHFREVRTVFLVKALLAQRVDEPLAPLVENQRVVFAPLFAVLEEQFARGEGEGVVAAWRYESSQAVARLLARL